MDIGAMVAEHGWALTGVLADGPGSPSFTYTVGLFDRLPELLCVGPDPGVAARTLEAVVTQLRSRPQLARAGQHLELPAAENVLRVVRLDAVARRWHDLYVLQALAYHRRSDLEVLQVLAPDEHGRFPDDPGVDPHTLHLQPVLADPDRPWRVPHGGHVFELLADDGDPPRHAVLLPVIDAGQETGREELVPARPTPTGWELTLQPSLADWCAAGDVVAASAADAAGTAGYAAVRFERVVRSSGRRVLRWETHLDDAGADRLDRILDRPRFAELVVGLGAAPHALSFAVTPRLAEPLRIALRPLERDGLLVPRRLFHQREDPDLGGPHPHCPECQAGR